MRLATSEEGSGDLEFLHKCS